MVVREGSERERESLRCPPTDIKGNVGARVVICSMFQSISLECRFLSPGIAPKDTASRKCSL